MTGWVRPETGGSRAASPAWKESVVSSGPYVDPGIDLPTRWRRHRSAIAVVVAVTLVALVGSLGAAGALDRQAVLTAARVQLLLMAVVVPVAAWPAGTRLDVLFRAGPTTDTFAVVVLTVAVLSPDVTLWQALGAYLLVAAVALAGMGVMASCRIAGPSRLVAACCAFAVLTAGAAGVVAPLPVKVNVDLALQDLLGLSPTATGWLITLLVAAAAAGMAWTAGYLAESRRRPSAE
jgi:hypothetical protein